MKSFYIEVDTNDGDYVGRLITISNEEFDRFKPLIEKIKNFRKQHNFCYGDVFNPMYDTNPIELYNIDYETFDGFMSAFELYSAGEYGFHTITSIQEVTLGEKIL